VPPQLPDSPAGFLESRSMHLMKRPTIEGVLIRRTGVAATVFASVRKAD
jgi:hypothetical protein